MKQQILNLSFGVMAVWLVIACSPAQFSVPCSGPNCVNVSGSGETYHEFTTTIGGGKVDILIVNDNSASMSTEQSAMANRFANFISALDSRSVDYRIAITTTDVSSTGLGGNLITFSNNSKFLTPSTTNKNTLFSAAIQRQETINCEAFLSSNPNPTTQQYNTNCPSGDERGVYAANLTVLNNPSSFIRSDAALAIIFLSDEDERSRDEIYTSYVTFALENYDMPQTLKSNVASRYPGKFLKMHSIIVRPGSIKNGMSAEDAANLLYQAWSPTGNESPSALPTNVFNGGDSSCLTTQNSQVNNVMGGYGYLYALATRMTGGIEGNVCASDYGTQLSTIGDQIGQNVNMLSVACGPERIGANPMTVTFLSGPSVSYQHVGLTLQFAQNLAPGTQVKVSYSCKPNL